MNKTKKIEIKISQEKLELLRKFGLSPEDVFVKGLESLLRQKYRELSLVDADDEPDEIEWLDVGEISKKVHEIDEFFVRENDISNN